MEIAFTAVFGLVIGSFLNVVGLRIPIGESITSPARSYCPSCKHTLGSLDLIPVLSYAFSLGKCRYCGKRISPLYPMIELLTGGVYGWIVYQHGWTFAGLLYGIVFSVLIVVCVSDWTYQLIPDAVMLPALVLVYIGFGLLQGHWLMHLIDLSSGAILITVIILASRGGMGEGDIRLNALIGLLLGWKLMLVSFVLACTQGSLLGGYLMLRKRATRKTAIPFGPYLAVAALITFFWADPLLFWYNRFLLGI
ncbi:MAG: tfpP [Bacilli bacterium]|nr:tfpP [Bacilli bacterium]